jgi:PEP-CTERM motif
MKLNTILLAAAAAVTTASLAAAADASVLFNTGYDASGSEIAVGTVGADAHWTVSGTGTGITGLTTYASANNSQFPIGYWVPDDTTSRWITPTQNAADSFDPSTNGLYSFSQSFSLSPSQLASASFTGQFAADNRVQDIKLNGVTIYTAGLGPSDYGSWTNFGDTNHLDFQKTNVLTFDVVNYAQNGGNPAGLDVRFTSGLGAPEPGTWAIMLVGLAGLGAMVRNRRQAALAA